MREIEVIIIGGGLAGLSAACSLGQKGKEVLLLEKSDYPRHKVCGEYVSKEVLPFLESIGFNPFDQGAVDISEFSLFDEQGHRADSPLPLGGFGLSRYAFDQALFKLAQKSGCEIKKDRVTEVMQVKEHFLVTTRSGDSYKAKVVLGAFGKRSHLDKTLNRPFMNKKAPYLAAKYHVRGDFPSELVGLYHFRGGYCGVSKVESGELNICYIVDYDQFKKYGDLADFEEEVLKRHPSLGPVLSNATMTFDRRLAISQISFENKSRSERGMLMLGDTAGMIHPLCGNGMAMALTSAQMASYFVVQYLEGYIDREQLIESYTKQWHSKFGNRMRASKVFNYLFYRPRLFSGGIRLLQKLPFLLPPLIRLSHGHPSDISLAKQKS
ncbi:MAG TPA: NAD(P)/FAD-dependent oxidoreductase [Saprospiraceae bacterium]|nr:NAD(P)/FAD-dependent oxidoreductase [Saprospiraceae bacterium]